MDRQDDGASPEKNRLPLNMEGVFLSAPPMAVACHCRGPQNGDPVCPCEMRHVQIVNGRYMKIVDLGPAPSEEERKRRKKLSPWGQSLLKEINEAVANRRLMRRTSDEG